MFVRFALYGFLKNLRFFEPFLILIFREAGLSYLQIGLLYSIRSIAVNIMEIPSGLFADAYGRRRSMLLAFGAYILSFSVFYTGRAFGAYALAMLIFAVGEAFRSGTHKALILEYLRQQNRLNEKVAFYGKTRSASQFGSAVNALIAAGIVFWSGSYRLMFLAATLPYMLDFINLAGYPAALDRDCRGEEKSSRRVRQSWQGFRQIFKNPPALRALLNSAGFTAFFKSLKDYIQPILQSLALTLPLGLQLSDKHRTALLIGAVYFVLYLLTSRASFKADWFKSRFKQVAAALNFSFLLGSLLLALSGLLLLNGYIPWAVAGFILFYILQNLRKPVNIAVISDYLPAGIMASGLSLESQITTVLTAGITPLLGYCADVLGIGAALLVIAALMLILSLWTRVH